MAGITSKGTTWELRNSLWMLWTILTFGLLNYVSFFYVSRKVKQKKWFKAGLVYSVIFIIFILWPDSFTGFFIISWLVSIFHVFKIRTEYLLRLEAVQASGLKNRELNVLKETIAREYDSPSSSSKTPSLEVEDRTQTKSRNMPVEAEYKKSQERNFEETRVDINTATEKEIADVPGLGSIFASKVVAVRNEHNGFKTFDHFVQALSIKPHVAEKIKTHIIFSNTSHNQQKVKKTEGRIVDF